MWSSSCCVFLTHSPPVRPQSVSLGHSTRPSPKSIAARVLLPLFLHKMLRTRNKAFPFGFPSFVQEFIQNVPHKWVLILICLLFFILVNLEGTQFATLSAVSNYVQPVTEILLVQIFLVRCFTYSTFWKQAPQKLQWSCCCFFQWLNPSTEILSFSIHTDALLKKQLKIGSIPDSVFYRVGAVKGKVQNLLFFFCPPLPPAFSQAPWQQQRQKRRNKAFAF